MRYNVGDKVRVRKDLKAGKRYGADVFILDMEKYSGKTMTVDAIISTGRYELKEDVRHWHWTDEMLEDAEGITILVKNNKVIAKRGNKVGIVKCSPEDEFNIFTGARLAIDRLEEKYNSHAWLKEGVKYYFPRVDNDNLYDYYEYDNDCIDKKFISRGLVFKTKEEAINCAKKMLEIVK